MTCSFNNVGQNLKILIYKNFVISFEFVSKEKNLQFFIKD